MDWAIPKSASPDMIQFLTMPETGIEAQKQNHIMWIAGYDNDEERNGLNQYPILLGQEKPRSKNKMIQYKSFTHLSILIGQGLQDSFIIQKNSGYLD